MRQIADYSALSLLHQRASAVECGDWFDYCFAEAMGDLSQGRDGNIDLRHRENPGTFSTTLRIIREGC